MEQAAGALETSRFTVSRWESGQANIRTGDLRLLFDLYAVPADERAELETLAREGRQRGWWTPYTSSVRPTFATFLGLEAEAASLMEYSAIILPGLLQTERYMRAVMRAAVPFIGDDTIERRTEVRLKRQAEIFARGYPMHFVIDQACLLRRVGGVDVMRDQLTHLAEKAKNRQITLQVIPFEIGAHASIMGSFSVLTFADMPPISYVEQLAGDLYGDGEDAALYTQHFDALREAALPKPLALELLERIRKETHQ